MNNPCQLRETPPLLVVLSGPSGVGKDAVITAMKRLNRPFHFTVTVTTRARRANEVHGKDYHFVDVSTFEVMKSQGDLLEWAEVHGNYYGTPLGQIRQALARGSDVLLKIDVQGAAQVKKRVPEAVFVFLAPPSLEHLLQRLRSRGTESEEDLRRRTEDAREEMRHLEEYDYVVVNEEGHLDTCVADVVSIITAEKLRVHPRQVGL